MVRSHARRSGISSVDDLESESVSTGEADFAGPSDFTTPAGQNIPARLKAPSSSNFALALQLADSDAPAGDPGYAAILGWFGSDGEEIGHISGDSRSEISIYTRDIPLSESAGGGSFEKRLNIDAGESGTDVEVASGSAGSVLTVATGDAGSTAGIALDTVSQSMRFRSLDGQGRVQWYDQTHDIPVFDYFVDDQVNVNTPLRVVSDIFGLREITNPAPGDLTTTEWAWDATDSRWLYKDDASTVHYFTPDGTL